MTCAMVLFSCNDAFCKIVLQTWPVGQVTFVRGVMMAIGYGVALLVWQQPDFWNVARRPAIIGRSIIDAFATIFSFVAIANMTLANFGAVTLVTPLLLTLLAAVIVKEPVGWRRWLAIAVGLIGGLIVVKPSPADFNPYAGFAFLCAAGAALRDLVTARMNVRATSLMIVFSSAVVVALGGLIWGLVAETWQPWTLKSVGALMLAAAFLGIGNFLVVAAFRMAPIASVAPFRYTLMLWSAAAGFLVFGDLPDRWFFVGGALILSAGLYTLHRERVRARYLASTAAVESGEATRV
jgi:drug/metabolite transporter (DMT)-like permease